ncbi:MAG: phosphate acetyltransferase [Ignavibacteriaceae bacterium]|jgi:phosphate acetyltransferase
MANNILAITRKKAGALKKTIILPESHDERVLQAAEILTKEEIGSVITIGDESKIKSDAEKLSVDLTGVKIINPLKSEKLDEYANTFYELRKKKRISLEDARNTIKRDLFFGAMMVREGLADGSVAGSTASTADVLRAGIQCIGMPEGISVVSSFFFMVFPDKSYTFSDCGVVPDPDALQLADIAISAAGNHAKLTGEKPYIAMLSFSTKGSAKHESIDKVLEALSIVKSKRPDLAIDGELQFDAAIVDSVGKRKAPGSEVAGRANVLIFPDLNAGNIGYKIAQRLGGCEAIGPLTQGLKKPFFDLSRGCTAEDIVNNAAIAIVLS